MELNGSLYGQDCVFIANDWHASLVPVYLAGADTLQRFCLRPSKPTILQWSCFERHTDIDPFSIYGRSVH